MRALQRFCILDGDSLHLGTTEQLELNHFDRVLVVGAGKASVRLAEGAVGVLGGRIAAGTITTKDGYGVALRGIDVWEAAHPLPDTRGLAGGAEALRLTRSATVSSLVLCLLSGGASALWPAPVPGVTLRDLRQVTDGLLRSGAPIHEVNAVRKHLSRIAGGQLARAAGGARIVTLAISDVVGSPPEVIGSGPTVADPTTFADALAVLRDREVQPPARVTHYLQRGHRGEVPETPKPEEPLWRGTSFHVLIDNRAALDAASAALARSGYHTTIVSARAVGEARGLGAEVVREARSARDSGAPRPHALVWGGETTVTVRGAGKGGRNQEMALAAAIALQGEPGITIGCFATDGTDGPTDAAGGIVDGETIARGRLEGYDPRGCLARNDAYPFLRAAGDLLVTGPTGTNVNDLVVALIE